MLTRTTPSQRIVLHATHYELRRDLVEGNPFHLGEDSLLFSITLVHYLVMYIISQVRVRRTSLIRNYLRHMVPMSKVY